MSLKSRVAPPSPQPTEAELLPARAPKTGRSRARKWLGWITAGQVTRDDVIWCYRKLLRREPESEAALQTHLHGGGLLRLVESFLDSEEFASKRPLRRFHPIPLPPARIDTASDPSRLAQAVAKVRATWSYLGEVRPHFSVLTNHEFLPHKLPNSIQHFWASGDEEALAVLAMLATQGVATEQATCVEYGCGVGRVTAGLARHFATVHGYDISVSHLQEARQRVQACGLDNVELHLCADALLEALQPCDVFYSRIVLQHNPPPLMLELVRMALSALRPGGVAIFQVPIYAEGYSFDFDAWLDAPPAQDMEMHCLPQSLLFEVIAQAGCLPLEVREEDSVGDPRYISNLFIVRRPTAAPATPAPGEPA